MSRLTPWLALSLSFLGSMMVPLFSAEPGDSGAKTETDLPAALKPGHSAHGEVFNEGPRQKAYLMEGTGKVHIEVTTKEPLAQKFFDQGLGQLHGFWYFEAERSFRQTADLDPDCAMAYWGMAMANFSNQKRSQGFIEHAVELKAKASRREQLWIDGLSAYVKSKEKDAKKRREEFIKSLEEISFEFPDELEAKALLAWALYDSRTNVPISSYQAVNALIGEVLAKEPLHPVHHYRIHMWDNRKPNLGLASSALCGQGSPSIAHMWHMPGHIYWKVQRYADSAWQQEASARVDHAHMIRDRVMPHQIHNYAHNNEWLTRSLSHVGRVRDAVSLAKNLIEQPQHPQKNHLKNRGGAAHFGRTRLIETISRYELWDEIVALAETPYLDATNLNEEQLRRLRVLGTAHFSRGDIEKGQEQIAAVEALRDKAREAQQKAVDDAGAKAIAEKKTDEQVAKAKTDAEKQHKSKIEPYETALSELTGHRTLAEGDAKGALVHFEKAKDLSKELLSRVQLAAGDADKAEKLAKQAVDAAKNQVQPLANYADILWRAGKKEPARAAFKQLRELSAYLDADLPVMKRLDPIAQDLGIEGDWRKPVSQPADVGERPSLDSLGPFRWQPSPAPAWDLPDSAGNLTSLEQHRGRPVVLFFYLGAGCLHCVEQLKKFAPLAAEYEAAGITLLAISTESVGDLSASLSNFSESGEFPIRLLANQALDVFRSYRVYDDFEERPLHGTFVIDGKGQVRWQDISYEPFTDAKFVLEETQRLLSLPHD